MHGRNSDVTVPCKSRTLMTVWGGEIYVVLVREGK